VRLGSKRCRPSRRLTPRVSCLRVHWQAVLGCFGTACAGGEYEPLISALLTNGVQPQPGGFSHHPVLSPVEGEGVRGED